VRIWWDKHAKHPSATRASFWRPVPPPGYVSLGDCLVAGMYCPPRGVTVIREAEPQGLAGTGAPPLLARPRGFVLVRHPVCLPAWP
jgi:vacuolar protein sorting-associated protein 13A/C